MSIDTINNIESSKESSYSNQGLRDKEFKLLFTSLLFGCLFFCFLIFGIPFVERSTFISPDEVLRFLQESTVRNNRTSIADYKNNFSLSYDGKIVVLTIDPIKKGWWREKALKLLSILSLENIEDVKFIKREELIRKLNSYPSLHCYRGFDRRTIQCEFQSDSVDTCDTSEELIKDTVPSIVLGASVRRLDRKIEWLNTNLIDWMVYLDPLENEEALKKLISLSQKSNTSILIHFIVYNESKIDEVIEKYKNADFLTDEEKKRLNKENILRNNFIAFKYGIKKLPLVLALTFNNETRSYEYRKCKDCL